MKKNCKKQIKRNLELKRGKVISCMSNGKVMIILLIVALITKRLYKMNQYFPKPYDCFSGNVKVELDLSNLQQKLI